MPKITSITVAYGEKRTKDYNSKSSDLSITIDVSDSTTAVQESDVSRLQEYWTDKLKAGVAKALTPPKP